MEIRKLVTIIEETKMEMGKSLHNPCRKAAAIAVIKNPFAGKYQENLQELIDIGGVLGGMLASKARDALGIKPEQAESFGKAVIVGLDGESEHAAAIIHPKFGNPIREVLGGGKARIPSTQKVGPAGTEIDVPLVYKDASTVSSHYDAMTVSVTDAPRPDEIVVAVVVTDSGRPLYRIPGLRKEDAKKEDGLR
jgi:hypothetical protein